MKAQHNIQAQNKTLLLMLVVACVAAFIAAKMTAAAQAAITHTAAIAATGRVSPPVEESGTYEGVHPKQVVIRDTIVPFRIMSVNRAGLAAKTRTFALVDGTDHVVSPKSTRLGGRYQESDAVSE